MRRILRALVAFLGVVGSAGVVYAATHFLVTWAFTYAEDASSEFSATQAFFSRIQSIRSDAGKWRPGDKFTVEYVDGMVVEFPLSTRGMVCIAGNCKWATTVPFDEPTIIKDKRSGLTSSLQMGRSGGGLSPVQYAPPILGYPVVFPYQRTWTVIVGPIVAVPSPPPSGCMILCPRPR